MEDCLVCSTNHLGGGRVCPGGKGHHVDGAHHGSPLVLPDSAGCLGEGVNCQGAAADAGRRHTADQLDETMTCVGGHG